MRQDPVSRRHFITAVTASGVIAGAQAVALPLKAAATTEEKTCAPLSPDRNIKIVSLVGLSKEETNAITAAGKNIDLHIVHSPDSSPHIEDAEVMLGWINKPILQRAKKLQWVHIWAGGVENLPPEIVAHPCTVTNMQRTFAPVIAESAIGLLLSLTRGLAQVSIPAMKQRKWTPAPENIVLDDLYGKTIGIVGMGGIGSETARRLHYGFNMKVIATDAKPMHKPEFVEELHDPGWLMEMVPQADVLMSAAPLTSETREMFNTEVFRRMKRSAYFINVSRGGLVNQDALVKALKENTIRGAGLDVTTPEPLPADHPLWTCPNIVITPHNSALADSRFPRMLWITAENVRRYSHGLPLMNVVDKEKGY